MGLGYSFAFTSGSNNWIVMDLGYSFALTCIYIETSSTNNHPPTPGV